MAKTYTITEHDDFDALEALPVEELLEESVKCEEVSYADLVFEAGITEAAKRLLRKEKYVNLEHLRTIFGVEVENE